MDLQSTTESTTNSWNELFRQWVSLHWSGLSFESGVMGMYGCMNACVRFASAAIAEQVSAAPLTCSLHDLLIINACTESVSY